MKVRLSDIRLEVDDDKDKLLQIASKKLKIKKENIKKWSIEKKSLDARRRRDISFVYTITLDIETEDSDAVRSKLGEKDQEILKEEQKLLTCGNRQPAYSPVIIGMGPAGLFAAWLLAKYGYKPVVLERGKKIPEREADVSRFWKGGTLDTESNVLFGEGGAGTFSDGKLTTRIKDERVRVVLDAFIQAGAPAEIAYLAKPHLGTDKLRNIVINMRKEIIDCGGAVFFQSRVTDFIISKGEITALIVNDKLEVPVSVCILAIGHSARDTYRALHKREFRLEPKPFAVGFRIEHPQHMIDCAQLGSWAGNPRLGAADYSLTYKNKGLDRAVYTFCMCPGGYVIGASSEENRLNVNGMSYYGRSSGTSNSAIVVAVGERDYNFKDPLSGIKFQQLWEEKAYKLGGGDYTAPVQTAEDFINNAVNETPNRLQQATYKPKVKEANLRECLPEEICLAISEALKEFDKKIWGFASNKGILTGIETRTSAPLRIKRQEDLQAIDILGLYPVGEGSGYAGGIISSAVDGLKAAQSIIEKYSKPLGSISIAEELEQLNIKED